MIVELDRTDIRTLAAGLEFTHAVVPFGALRIYSFDYENGKGVFLLDYPTASAVRCELTLESFNNGVLTAVISAPESRKTAALAALLTGIIPKRFRGITLRYPHLTVDTRLVDLPFVPRLVEAKDDSVRITAALKIKPDKAKPPPV